MFVYSHVFIVSGVPVNECLACISVFLLQHILPGCKHVTEKFCSPERNKEAKGDRESESDGQMETYREKDRYETERNGGWRVERRGEEGSRGEETSEERLKIKMKTQSPIISLSLSV